MRAPVVGNEKRYLSLLANQGAKRVKEEVKPLIIFPAALPDLGLRQRSFAPVRVCSGWRWYS